MYLEYAPPELDQETNNMGFFFDQSGYRFEQGYDHLCEAECYYILGAFSLN